MTNDISFILTVIGVITDIAPPIVNIDLYYTIIIRGCSDSITIETYSTSETNQQLI